jgi:hypothetical protein
VTDRTRIGRGSRVACQEVRTGGKIIRSSQHPLAGGLRSNCYFHGPVQIAWGLLSPAPLSNMTWLALEEPFAGSSRLCMITVLIRRCSIDRGYLIRLVSHGFWDQSDCKMISLPGALREQQVQSKNVN